ncbi:MAG TPA: lipoyl(octanoyl) transferase LipB [Steroidobacteraceae bacterium]|nr:lipoyl(octanoyl) transferase LipB [Steroidobacteraceae bacterium]
MTAPGAPARCRWLGRRTYEPVWRAMQRFTEERGPDTLDEIWLLEHEAVFTLGMGADPAHVLAPGDIPVVRIDRGGQVTYHGPGQLVVYVLIDLRRAGLGVRALVSALEQAVIECAAEYGIRAQTRAGAPGVYVQHCKLASVGLRVRRGGSYHGLALNVNLDLAPFGRINPCGYAGLQMTQLAALGGPAEVRAAARQLAPRLAAKLGLSTMQSSWDAGVSARAMSLDAP